MTPLSTRSAGGTPDRTTLPARVPSRGPSEESSRDLIPPPARPSWRPAAPGPADEQGHRLHRRRTRRARAARAAAAARVHPGPAAAARLRQLQAQARPAREVHLPEPAPGAERDAVLPARPRAPRGDDADHLHADGGAGVPEVRPHLAPPAWVVRVRAGPRPREGDPPELAQPGRADHRHHGRRAHPRPGRPRRQRDGHPGRQALAVHRVRGRAAGAVPARHAGRRHRQPGAARGPALPRPPAAAPARRRVRRARGRVRHRRADHVPARVHPVRGLRQLERVPPAAQVPGPRLHVQRRHPGHGRRHAGRAGGRPAAHCRRRRAAPQAE